MLSELRNCFETFYLSLLQTWVKGSIYFAFDMLCDFKGKNTTVKQLWFCDFLYFADNFSPLHKPSDSIFYIRLLL